jgi:hypothetical protein
MPIDGDPRACYALWEDGEVKLRRVKYDVQRAVKRLSESGLRKDVATKMGAVLRHGLKLANPHTNCRTVMMRMGLHR